MAEGTYEYECMRAELLGQEKPDKEKFELERAEKIKAEQEEINALQAQELGTADDGLQGTGGKLDELNSILSATQQKLNRFKKTACGSLTNIFKGQSVDDDSQIKKEHSNANQQAPCVNNALSNLEAMETVQAQSDLQFAKNASLDIQKKMTSHIDVLDSLIEKADTAEHSMTAQNKQMKKYLK